MENLVCENITKEYGKKNSRKKVLDDINLTLEKGKIYGLIGRNGVGKTTLLSILSAQNPATCGKVTWNGEEVWENQEALSHICFSREISLTTSAYSGGAVSGFKVKDYLKIAAHYYRDWDQEMADHLIGKFELDPKKRLANLSKGMLSMVTIIVALASKADYTFLDEPVAGLDVVMREYFYKVLLEEYTNTGRTFVVSTHIIEEAADVFEEVIILKKGRLLLKENTQELLERAYEISGLEEVVDEFAEQYQVCKTERVGRRKSIFILLENGQSLPEGYDVTIQQLNLQNVFVALCGMEA